MDAGTGCWEHAQQNYLAVSWSGGNQVNGQELGQGEGGSLLASVLGKLLPPGEEGTNGASSCAAHRQAASLETGLHVSLQSNLQQ